jgi:CBS domain-containing protein
MEKVLRVTISGLETGLRVLHIATFDLKTCSATQSVTDVADDASLADFDYIPVREKARIVGVLDNRGQRPLDGSVRDHMLPLDGSVLVTADEPLTRFVPLLRKRPYRLVLLGTEIRGIVTRSDIIKPPVRLLAFTLVSHLEMVMTDFIRACCPTDDAFLGVLGTLDLSRRKKLEKRHQQRQQKNLLMPAVEIADFDDKRVVVTHLCKLEEASVQELLDLRDLCGSRSLASGQPCSHQNPHSNCGAAGTVGQSAPQNGTGGGQPHAAASRLQSEAPIHRRHQAEGFRRLD